MKTFKYNEHGSQGVNYCPMLPDWMVDLGTDKEGKVWMCKITPTNILRHLMWNVDFDTTDEWDAKGFDIDPNDSTWSMPFLRTEVLYATDYHAAVRKFYHRKEVEYKDIYKTIFDFVETHGIE